MNKPECPKGIECDEYRKWYENTIEKATSYTDIIISIGYIGFLNLFLIIKDALTTELKVIIAALILTSLSFFICWETIKMLLLAINEAKHYLDKNSLKIILFTVWIIFFVLIAITFSASIFFLAKGIFLHLLN